MKHDEVLRLSEKIANVTERERDGSDGQTGGDKRQTAEDTDILWHRLRYRACGMNKTSRSWALTLTGLCRSG